MTACTGCGEDKEPEAFGFRDQASGRRHRRCKLCVAAYGKGHYTRNRAAYIRRNGFNKEQRRHALKARLWAYLAQRSCVDCGEHDLVVLDFDHVSSSQKRAELYRLVQSAYGWRVIGAELAKCEVRCANCHRRRTAEQFSWPRRDEPNDVERARSRCRLQRPPTQPVASRPPHIPAAHRWCRWCGQIRAEEHFYARDRPVCAECFRRYRQAHYRLNRKAYVERNVRLLRDRRRRWLQRLWAYLTTHPCIDCGADDPRILEFDHRDRLAKLDSVTVMAQQGSAWAKIDAEMAKCDVRCANCHRRRTALQFGWPKLRISTDE